MRQHWIVGIAAAAGVAATLWTTYLHAQSQRPADGPLLLHAAAPVGANPAFVSGDDEDVHSFVERQLVKRVGDAGRRLHTGRSRNEQVSLDLRLYLRRRIPLLQRAVAAVVDALAAQAASAGDALMPSFTHFRPAQPVLVAHFFLSHAAPLRRDFARLSGARDEADVGSLASSDKWELTEYEETQRVWTDDYSNVLGAVWRRLRDGEQ